MSSRYLRIAISLILLFGFGCRKSDTGSKTATLTVVSYGGGAYQESHKKAFGEPFNEITGALIQSTVWDGDYGKLKATVESGKVTWDVVDVTAAHFARGRKENLFEKLDIKPHDGDFHTGAVNDDGVANVYWGTVLAYRRSAYSSKSPKTWADFWNIKDFPGPRAMYDDPRGNLEFALLADGVPREKLYPLDITRAFKKLDEIKPHVRVWWSDGTQPVQLLLANSVSLATAWNGRIYASKQARAELDYSWADAALELDYWIIPRGSKNRNLASRFILFSSLPYTLARQAEIVGYGPVNTTALKYLSNETLIHLPTHPQNWAVTFVVNPEWWSANEVDMKIKWISWKSK